MMEPETEDDLQAMRRMMNTTSEQQEQFVPPSLSQMVIRSVDTLRRKPIPFDIPDTWNEQPPLLSHTKTKNKRSTSGDSSSSDSSHNNGRRTMIPMMMLGGGGGGKPTTGKMVEETPGLLKGMLRLGVPPALRCAIWLSNIIQKTHPHEDSKYWHEYRTLSKAVPLDEAYECLLQSILSSSTMSKEEEKEEKQQQPEEGDHAWDYLQAPTYGQTSPYPKLIDVLEQEEEQEEDKQLLATTTPAKSRDNRLIKLKRVLIAVQAVVGGAVDSAPLLPTLAALLLLNMSESYAFCALREMVHMTDDDSYYFPLGSYRQLEYKAWCSAFCDVLRKLHKSTYTYLEDRAVLDDLSVIFQDFFVGILKLEHVFRIMDIYTLEGGKVLFRFGVALLVLYKMESAEQLITISNAQEWWNGMREWTHDIHLNNTNSSNNQRPFDFELVIRKAYGVHGHGARGMLRGQRPMGFPRRSILQRIIKIEEARLYELAEREEEEKAARGGDNGEKGRWSMAQARPLGLVRHDELLMSNIINGDLPMGKREIENIAKPIFAESMQVRLHLAQWLPLTLQMSNIELVYSTNHHGRSLEIFFNRVRNYRHTILLCEVLVPATTKQLIAPSAGESSSPEEHLQLQHEKVEQPQSIVIGMYASQVWRASPHVYGDGRCFLFRLEPDAKCWKWNPTARHHEHHDPPLGGGGGKDGSTNRVSLLDTLDLTADYDDSSTNNNNYKNNQTALLEQFMVGTHTYISMGGNQDGSAGLRLNEDFTRGESSTAAGFENEPLPGVGASNVGNLFEIGLVEVYGLVRHVDGKPA